jgi:hypothetical protein
MIQAFPTQQLSGILTMVGLLEELQFVFHGETPSGRFGHDLRIGWQRLAWRAGSTQGRCDTHPSGSLGLTLLALARLRGGYRGKSFLAE